jgi:FixJ family two-component response regulator
MSEDAVIHIVDDDPSLRTALQSLFRSVGMMARAHASVRAFLDAERVDAPGRIWAENIPSGGARFAFTLPIVG